MFFSFNTTNASTDSDWTNFTEHYNRPAWNYEREPFFSFGIGGSGSGVPFHTHGAGRSYTCME